MKLCLRFPPPPSSEGAITIFSSGTASTISSDSLSNWKSRPPLRTYRPLVTVPHLPNTTTGIRVSGPAFPFGPTTPQIDVDPCLWRFCKYSSIGDCRPSFFTCRPGQGLEGVVQVMDVRQVEVCSASNILMFSNSGGYLEHSMASVLLLLFISALRPKPCQAC